jgi:hypothetical protein
MNPNNYIFRYVRGRIIVINKKPLYAGAAIGATMGIGTMAIKARQKLAESIKGKGKKSFGLIPNTALEIGATAGGLTLLNKKFKIIGKGFKVLRGKY